MYKSLFNTPLGAVCLITGPYGADFYHLSLFCSLLLAACFDWLKDLGGWELEATLLVGLVLGDLV